MIINSGRLEQDDIQFDLPLPPSAGQFASFLGIAFFIGFLLLTLIAYLQARGIYFALERPLATLLSFLVTATTVLFYWAIGLMLIYPHNHHAVAWIQDHGELTYTIDATLGIGWYVVSYIWYRIVSQRFAEKFRQ